MIDHSIPLCKVLEEEERVKQEREKGASGMAGAEAQGSEVARILRKIREEYDAALQGLTGISSGTTKHAFITARMKRMGRLHEELKEMVGESAMALIANQLEGGSGTTSSSIQALGTPDVIDEESHHACS